MDNIYLTGMMGSGKTVIGRQLASDTEKVFFDIDEWVKRGAGLSIPEIFEQYGEARFRELESKALQDISQKEGVIVSCGGGIILSDDNVDWMKRTGRIVYIERDIDSIRASLKTENRPLLDADGENLKEIFEQRKDRYEQTCDFKVKNDGTPEHTVQAIRALMAI